METLTISNPDTSQSLPERRLAMRTSMAIEIVLRGSDKSGKPFIEKTRTVNISRTGAKTMTEHAVSHGARLQVAVPHLKRTSWATVAWVGDKTGNQQEIGIAVDETVSFWGVQLPDEPQEALASGTLSDQAAMPKLSVTENEGSDQLSKLLQELAQKAIEHSLGEALRQMNQQAAEVKDMQEALTKQTEARLRQFVEDALQRVEAAASEVTDRSRQACEEGIQALADSAQEQLRTQLAEHKTHLANSAVKVRRELGQKFSDLSSAFVEE